jgi:uncharacterized protein YjbJ (UPF0337 family)
MDRDRLEGIGHQLMGAVKQSLGVILGDAKLRAEGITERSGGKVQGAAGKAEDVARHGADVFEK